MSDSTPRVLILRHSFIKHLKQFVKSHPGDFDLDFHISSLVLIRWHGVGGRTVDKTLKYDIHVVHSFHPDIVILQLGSNDLVTLSPLHVGSALDDFGIRKPPLPRTTRARNGQTQLRLLTQRSAR